MRRRGQSRWASALGASWACVALLLLPSCATTKLLRAQKECRLVSLPERSPGNAPPSSEIRFANGVVAVLYFPFAIVFDVVSFPVQVIAEYPPYDPDEEMD